MGWANRQGQEGWGCRQDGYLHVVTRSRVFLSHDQTQVAGKVGQILKHYVALFKSPN